MTVTGQPGAGLRIEALSFSYGALPVLGDLTLSLAPGEMAALLGPNGSGKSTLLNLSAGVLRPGGGRIGLNDADLAELSPRERARKVAMVPQSLSISFAFTVRELVSLGRTPHLSPLRGERREDLAAIARAMEQADVADLGDRLVGQISGGERQRAALAMALAQEPALLLLDEPTAHLDVHHQMGLLGLVRSLNREQGITVLAAMHDMNLAALWFDRILLLDEGRIAADGAPPAVLRPDLIERVFRNPVAVLSHPTEGVPLVVLKRS
jgi:iron complex transport system ATP-binding protein